ncbi:hypothetical protein Ocin01_08301 [Orchesella cincta]|uniref:Transmembrane protein n=1 Tax=Orchesella cincta TaxID=48709 RepID=A0A1D2MZD7_ORCCI|nr:hypothetical protein Ocin01_08301 [Orchesella cincta]
MFQLRDKNCHWVLGLINVSNGICLIVLSSLFLNQTWHLLKQQRNQAKEFAHVHEKPFKNSNWMKSAIPLVISSILGILIGVIQTIALVISLLMDNSKSYHQQRKMGWLVWLAAGMFIFILSTLSFGLAVILKAHEYRNPKDSVSFWTNYRFNSSELIHNVEGHAFCSALAWNCAVLLASMAIVAAKTFRQRAPHILLGM